MALGIAILANTRAWEGFLVCDPGGAALDLVDVVAAASARDGFAAPCGGARRGFGRCGRDAGLLRLPCIRKSFYASLSSEPG